MIVLELTDIIAQGCTCLGTNPETGDSVEEGMQGARRVSYTHLTQPTILRV